MLAAACASADTEKALFEADIALAEGQATTHFSVWTSTEHAEAFPDDTALLARVAPPDGEDYSFLFPSYEGSDAYAMVPLLRFADMNGDGLVDVEALFAQGASNTSSTYFLYDPADGRLHYSAELGILSNAVYVAEEQVILSLVNDGAARQYYSLFGFMDATPALLRTASIEAFEANESPYLQISVASAVTGDMLLEETVSFNGDQSAIWDAQYMRMMQAFYNDIYGELYSPI